MGAAQERVAGYLKLLPQYTSYVRPSDGKTVLPLGPNGEKILKFSSTQANAIYMALKFYHLNDFENRLYGTPTTGFTWWSIFSPFGNTIAGATNALPESAADPNFVTMRKANIQAAIDSQPVYGYLTPEAAWKFVYNIQSLTIHIDVMGGSPGVGDVWRDILVNTVVGTGKEIMRVAAEGVSIIDKVLKWAPYVLIGYIGYKLFLSERR